MLPREPARRTHVSGAPMPTALLPHEHDALTLTDGGLETSLIFLDGLDLPDFAAFPLLETDEGSAALERYFEAYIDVARRHGTGLVLESATWRANADWGDRLGYDAERLAEANRRAVRQLRALRDRNPDLADRMIVSGCVGPRGDGYVADTAMTAEEAAAYHRPQVAALRDGGADVVTAITMTSSAEATGVALAAQSEGIPVVISFTVETDGRLPSGESLDDAIAVVDATTGAAPAYFMVNCAHPTHFAEVIDPSSPSIRRIKGLRANASTMSHAELDDAEELDAGDPADLAERYAALRARLPELSVMGGCCGTDARHVDAIGAACAPLFRSG